MAGAQPIAYRGGMAEASSAPAATGARHSPLVLACLAATWLIWGSTYLAIKFALVAWPPFLMMASRFIVAGGALALYMRARGTAWPTARQWRNAAIVGSLMLVGGMGGTAHAEQSIGSGLVVAFIAVTPLLMVIASLPFGVHPRPGETLGILVGLGGVLMLVRGAGFAASPAGLGWMIFACSGWTIGSVLSQRRFPAASGAMGFASQMLCGGVVLLLLAWISGEHVASPVPLGAWLAWGYLVVFGSLLGFNAYMVLLARASPAVATSYTYVNPIIALLLGVWLGSEQVTPWEWLAAAVVLAGVVLMLASRR
jgi:drug/metabolite transporter (DMT)-like permease